MAGNTFTYNGITIPTPDVKIVESAAVYDASDTSVMYTKTVLRVTGTIQTLMADTMAATAIEFRKRLLDSRGALVVNFGGVDMFNLPAGDDVGGPKPRKCELVEIIGTSFTYVNFEIEIGQHETCDDPSNVISHSYTASHSLDNRFYTTRVIRGTIRVRQLATGNNNPDALRGLVVPELPNGFQRTAMDFLVSFDGLTLDYAITDKEVFRVAPLTGVEWRATFEQQSSHFNWFNHFAIEMKGSKNQDQFSMMQDMWTVASSRIDFTKEMVLQSSIREDLHDNTVGFQVTTQVTGDPGKLGQVGNGLLPTGTRIFTGIGITNNAAATLGPYGTALIMAAKKTFFDSCGLGVNPTNIRYAKAVASNTGVLRTDGSAGAVGTNGAGSDSGNQSQDQKLTPYVSFNQIIEYKQSNGVVVLPSTYALAAGRVYQLHNPFMIIHQHGTAIRTGKLPDAPTPQSTNAGTINKRDIWQYEPVLMPDKKTFQYGIGWDYEIVVPFTANDLVSAASGAAVIIDTKLGTGTDKYALPENLATTFDPANATTQVAVAAPIVVPPTV